MNLMQQHQQRLAGNTAPKATTQKVAQATNHDMQGLGLNAELQRISTMIKNDSILLKEIKSHEQRDEEKKLLIPKYESYLNAYFSQNTRHKNPVLVQVMVWAFDTKQIDMAMELAGHAIKQNDDMPEGFNSKIQEWVLDTLHDYLDKEYKAERSCEPYLSDTLEYMGGLDTFDQIKSKYHKLAGLIASDAEAWRGAVEQLELAEKFNTKAMVTTKLNKAKKELAKIEALAVADESSEGETESGDVSNDTEAETNEAEAS
ncbi:MAG: phage terminase small subunit [Cycloclasticus sp.]